MLNLFHGAGVVNVSGDEIRMKIIELEAAIRNLQDELTRRSGNGNVWRHGFLAPDGVWLGFDTLDKAIAGAKEVWPDDEYAPYRVTRVYI